MADDLGTCEVCGKPVEDGVTLCLEHRPTATQPQAPDLPEWIELPEWAKTGPANQWLRIWIIPEALRRGYKSVWLRATAEQKHYLQPVRLTPEPTDVTITLLEPASHTTGGGIQATDINWDVFQQANEGHLLLDAVEVRWGSQNAVLFNDEVDLSVFDWQKRLEELCEKYPGVHGGTILHADGTVTKKPDTPQEFQDHLAARPAYDYGFIKWRLDLGKQWIYNTPEMLKAAGVDTSAKPEPVPQYMELANSAVYCRAREIIARGDFSCSDGEKWPTAHIECDTLTADVQIKPDPAVEEPYLTDEELLNWQEKAADIALEMDDETADVLDYITYEVVTQAKHAEQDVTFGASRFSQLRGRQKQKSSSTGRRGGFKTEYRRNFAREVEKLGTTWIRVAEMEVIEPDDKGKRRKSTKRGLESRAIVLSARTGQLNLGGRIEPDTYRGRLGPLFAASIFGPWRQVALVSIKALSYNPYRQLPEKRLTRYLSWQWRIRQGFGNYLQPYGIATVLTAIGLKISKHNPSYTKDRFERALDALNTDGVIAGWQYGTDWEEEIVGEAGWTDKWQRCTLVIEPPQEVIDHYKDMPAMEPKTPKALPAKAESIGDRVRAARLTLGLTQMQAAEEIGINQATLSRIERGANAAPGIHKKIEAWLARVHADRAEAQA